MGWLAAACPMPPSAMSHVEQASGDFHALTIVVVTSIVYLCGVSFNAFDSPPPLPTHTQLLVIPQGITIGHVVVQPVIETFFFVALHLDFGSVKLKNTAYPVEYFMRWQDSRALVHKS